MLVSSWGRDVGQPVEVIGVVVVTVGAVLAAGAAGGDGRAPSRRTGRIAVACGHGHRDRGGVDSAVDDLRRPWAAALTRDTVVAAVMITVNGIGASARVTDRVCQI